MTQQIELSDTEADNLVQILEANEDADSLRRPLFWDEQNMDAVEAVSETVSEQIDT